MNELTVIIGPRDRYTGVIECIDSIAEFTPLPFDLIVLDLKYPRALRREIDARVASMPSARVVDYGLITPMQALRRVLPEISTPRLAWIDNDSRVTEGWYEPLKDAVDSGAAVASPLILEREGVDIGASIRNHLHSSEIRVVSYEGTDYLIEHKKFRRELPENLGNAREPTETFELHGVLFDTAKLKSIDIPDMVVREHIDICMQLQAMGESVVVEPRSTIIFDNLGTRMVRSDMRFFFFRWGKDIASRSHREFEKRWGYGFYSEQSMYNWAFRRKVFLVCRWLHLPINVSNKVAGLMKRLFCRDWDPMNDPTDQSRHLYSSLPDGRPNYLGAPAATG